jgi:hypothetical protein
MCATADQNPRQAHARGRRQEELENQGISVQGVLHLRSGRRE